MKVSAGLVDKVIDFVLAETGLKAIVCDTTGTIIAAAEKERIGSVHSGACRILFDGSSEVVITPEEEIASGGVVRVGVNLPIVYEEKIVGTFGIAGEPDLVRYVARISSGLIRDALDAEKKNRHIAEQAAILQKEKAFADAVIDSIPGMLYLYDAQGRLVRWNKRHETITGYSAEELSKMKLMDWYEGDPAAAEHIAREAGRAFSGGFADAEEYLRIKDGSRIPMYFTAVRLDIDGAAYIVGIGLDITERKKAEQALHDSHDSLERKVEERARELIAANEELRALNEEMIAMNEDLVHTNERLQTMQKHLVQSEKMAALGSLVAGVAHEINTPVGVGVTAASHLSNITEQFMLSCVSCVPEKRALNEYLEDIQEAASIIQKNLERAGRLIKSFKQVSVDQSSESRRTFKVREYLDEILLSLHPQLRKSSHTVVVECDPEISISSYPGAMAQIITNLLMNSLAHAYEADAAGKIRIDVEKRDNMLELRYSDDGKGMEREVLSKIFEPFFTTRRGTGGTGLGLYMVYNIVNRQLGGSIECQSEPGRGTQFTVKFPV